jgi:hypothetical protein
VSARLNLNVADTPSSSAQNARLFPVALSSPGFSCQDAGIAAQSAPHPASPLASGSRLTQPPPSSQPSQVSAATAIPSRGLAVPIERRWTANRDVQQQKQHHEKTGKELQKEMDDTKRRSVMFIIYHTVSVLFNSILIFIEHCFAGERRTVSFAGCRQNLASIEAPGFPKGAEGYGAGDRLIRRRFPPQ